MPFAGCDAAARHRRAELLRAPTNVVDGAGAVAATHRKHPHVPSFAHRHARGDEVDRVVGAEQQLGVGDAVEKRGRPLARGAARSRARKLN